MAKKLKKRVKALENRIAELERAIKARGGEKQVPERLKAKRKANVSKIRHIKVASSEPEREATEAVKLAN